jgi:hypothetical protein
MRALLEEVQKTQCTSVMDNTSKCEGHCRNNIAMALLDSFYKGAENSKYTDRLLYKCIGTHFKCCICAQLLFQHDAESPAAWLQVVLSPHQVLQGPEGHIRTQEFSRIIQQMMMK